MPTSNRYSFARKFEESSKMGKHKTVLLRSTGAPIDDAKRWKSIDWSKARREVRRLQMRIAKAVTEGKHGKVKTLHRILTHSFHAKALAVKRVTSIGSTNEMESYNMRIIVGQSHKGCFMECSSRVTRQLSSTVPRGEWGGNVPDLPGSEKVEDQCQLELFT